jgi:hypothetical protein
MHAAAAPSRIEFLARMTYAVLRRPKQNRNSSNVVAEYSRGWEEYHASLKRARSIDDWLRVPGVEDQAGYFNVDGRLSYEAFDSVGYYRRALHTALHDCFPDAHSVTEYGCGVGRNLLWLKREIPSLETFGYELCQPGVDTAREAAQKFGFNISYSQLDYVRDPPEKFLFPPTDVAFTMFSLEQIPKDCGRALMNILEHVRLGTIHIEPVPENYPLSFRGLLGRIDHWKVDYLSGFHRTASALNVQIARLERLGSAHNPLVFPSLYVLRKPVS